MRRFALSLAPAGPTRREALAGLAASLTATLGPGCAPATGDTATASPGSIDHVIFVMFENRSFDHFLGAMKLLEGRELDGLEATMSNADADGTVYGPTPADTQCLYDPPHGWSQSHSQWNHGACDGFVTEYAQEGAPEPGAVLSYMSRDDLPVTWALADAYAVCDRYFASVMGPTWPNRLYGHSGTSLGQDNNDYPSGGGFTMPTVWSKLDEIGVSWKYYYTDLPFLVLFKDTMRPETTGVFEDFLADCASGNLPAVSWVDPGFSYNDDHPPHFVGLGQELLGLLYQALATSPKWNNCLLVLTYDEHGGFFDHVSPPTTADDYADDGFDQLGFRVPTIVVGPYVKPGVSSEIFDHTSWLKFVCERFGIEPWTARIAAANSLALLIDQDRLAAGTPLPPADAPTPTYDESLLGDECFGGGLGPTAPPSGSAARTAAPRSGQPELEAWVAVHAPHLDHTDGVAARFSALRALRPA